MGLESAEGADIKGYLPRWLTAAPALEPDSGVAMPQVRCPSSAESRLFPRAVLSAGVCHCINNIETDMDRHLRFWDSWLEGFRAVMTFLGRRDLLDQFKFTCLNTAVGKTFVGLFNTEAPKTPKWRWGLIKEIEPQQTR